MLYDYLKGNKKVLSHDGKTPSIVIIENINDDVFEELGRRNMLTGKALEDYEKASQMGSKGILAFLTVLILTLSTLWSSITYAFCFKEASEMYGVSPELLWSIAKVESNLNPNAINWNKNGTYDYGLMQINSWWRNVLGDRLWQYISDPCMNVKIGAWILAQCLQRFGYTWEAVGCYNAVDIKKREKYARKVYSTYFKYFGR
jgi:soluble lytic murein transglycosylase-like protein